MAERATYHKFLIQTRVAGSEEDELQEFGVVVDDEFRAPRTWEEALRCVESVSITDPRSEPLLVEVKVVRSQPVSLRMASDLLASNADMAQYAIDQERLAKAIWDEAEAVHDGEIVGD